MVDTSKNISPLFRAQVLVRQKEKLHGDVLIVPTLSHSVITLALIVWVILVFAWLSFAKFSRKETVLGWLEPSAGTTPIYAEQIGTVTKIMVKDGDFVAKGAPLFQIENLKILKNGQSLTSELIKELQNQKQLLDDQISSTPQTYQIRNKSYLHSIESVSQARKIIINQLATVTGRQDLIITQKKRLEALKQRGLISALDIDHATEEELKVNNDHENLERNLLDNQSELDRLRAEQELLSHQEKEQLFQLRTKLSDISQQLSRINGEQVRVIRSPVAGVVNSLQIHEGLQLGLDQQIPLITLLPSGEQLHLQLLVPVRSIGFIEIGQMLNVRYDAFPYQKFGVYHANLNIISKALLLPNEIRQSAVPFKEPVYRVTASITQNYVHAYGKDFALKPGMTLSADISLGDRTLLEWLLEPIYSLRGRI